MKHFAILLAVLVLTVSLSAQLKPNVSAEFSRTAVKALLVMQANYTGSAEQTSRMQDALENAEAVAQSKTEHDVMDSLAQYNKSLDAFRSAFAKVGEMDPTLVSGKTYTDDCGTAIKAALQVRAWHGYPAVCTPKAKQ